MSNHIPSGQLKRELGIFGAIMMGLGAIIGTGVFVSIGIAAGVAGSATIIAIAIAAIVATCNGLNSAQLAANHPVSGGSYAYGYKYLTPSLGFTAGWMFLIAKSASAATAALGFAGYFLNFAGLNNSNLIIPLALGAVIIFTIIVLTGIQKSNLANILIVSITLFSLIFFIIAGLPIAISQANTNLNFSENSLNSVLNASALMFVAYTGYGRIATLGEEVREPQKTIPKAIIFTLFVTMLLYIAVGTIAISIVGANQLSQITNNSATPLELVASNFQIPGSSQILAIGAITAMLGVLLNLIIGLSRVVLAMARCHDIPRIFSRLNQSGTTPYWAVIIVGIGIISLVLIGNVKTTWSFSAFSVLIYYAITNLAALNLSTNERLYPRWIGWIGLFSCLFLAFWVDRQIWIIGLGLIGVGLIWHNFMKLLK